MCSPRVDGCAESRTGSQAGDPLGDTFFVAVYVRVQRNIRDDLRKAGLIMEVDIGRSEPCWCPSTGDGERVEVSDGSYLDDTVYFLADRRAANLPSKLRSCVNIIWRRTAQCGLQINVAQGKTEAIVDLRGVGAKATRAQIAVDGGISFSAGHVGNNTLLVVDVYKHVGSLSRAGGDMKAEVQRRTLEMRSSVKDISARLLGAPAIGNNAKRIFGMALCESKLLVHAGSWPMLPPPLEAAAVPKALEVLMMRLEQTEQSS